jgi:hypothetical protein
MMPIVLVSAMAWQKSIRIRAFFEGELSVNIGLGGNAALVSPVWPSR